MFFKFFSYIRSKKSNKLKRLLVDSIALSGCLYQMWIVTMTYLAFDVATRVYIYLPKTIKTPAVSICSSYHNIIDMNKVKSKYKQFRRTKHPLSFDQTVDIQNTLTIGEIFNFTPKVKVKLNELQTQNLLDKCRIRSPHNYSIPRSTSSQCENYFSIVRFVSQESLCYDFKLVNETIHNAFRLSQSLAHNGLFYKLFLRTNKLFLHGAAKMRITIHTPHSFPYLSYSLSPIVWRSSHNQTRFDFNKFIVSFTIFQVRLMPPPYVTQCDIKNRRTRCYNGCLHNLTVEQLGKVPFGTLISEDELKKGTFDPNDHIVSTRDVQDVERDRKIKNISSTCNKLCHQASCYHDFTLTSPTRFKLIRTKYLEIEVGSVSQPFVKIHTSPSFIFNDYILMILSLSGFWLGLGIRNTLMPIFMFILNVKKNNYNQRQLTSKIHLKKKNISNKVNINKHTVFCIETRYKALNDLINHFNHCS